VGSAAADVLDILVMEGTRAALVPLVLAPDTGVLELPLPLFNLLFLYAFQTLSPLMYSTYKKTYDHHRSHELAVSNHSVIL